MLFSLGVFALLASNVICVTVDELALNEATCNTIRRTIQESGFGVLPCECQQNTGHVRAVPCYPNCCPRTASFEGHRCHTENRLSWSVYEQTVCIPRPPVEYTADTPNCFYKGNDPELHSVTVSGSTTLIHFSLNMEPEHHCNNLFLTQCQESRTHMFQSFRLNTTRQPFPGHCWLHCEPIPLAPCTEQSCNFHRGETNAKIHEWRIPIAVQPGDYALVCHTLRQHEAIGSTLFQDQYSATFFNIAS